jgi:glycosyltransferase involved in cell wall biosynthesis
MLSEFPAPGTLPKGGPQVAVTRLVPELVGRGVDVVVVAPDPLAAVETETELDGGGTLVTVPTGARLQLARALRPWRARARAVVERVDADLVHGQDLIPGGIAAAGVDGLPRVVTSRGNMREDTIAAYDGVGGSARAYMRDRLARVAFEGADVVVSVNPDWKINLPAEPKRFVFIPNIVGEEFFARARRPEPGLVLFAGGNRAIKGWPLVAAAWPRVREAVPHARLNVIGWRPGEARPTLTDGSSDSLLLEEWVSSEGLAERMARASALVIASEFEVSPIVLAEAWAAGLPVVAVAVGGIPALAGDGALLVERDADALAQGLMTVLTDSGRAAALAAEGARRAEQHRAAAVAAAHIALYDELV